MIDDVNRKWAQALSNEPCCFGKKLVMGEGNGNHPALMLIGEAPGGREEEQGRPFVGKAGQNLNEFLDTLALKREEIYITNAVKIRPSVPGKNGKEKNRLPSQTEIALFLPWVLEEIRMVGPRLLVTLGNTPLKVILGKSAAIGGLHGKLTETALGVPLYPLYHPAAVIYNQSLRAVYAQDLANLRPILLKVSQP